MTAAAELHPVVVHHLVNTLGWPALRPLQEAAVGPLLAGDDALLVAPTAGGKTEAAVLPLLSAMADGDWRGLSVLYVCPLRALLNNLEPRLAGYTGWLGRRAALWHGDTTSGQRKRHLTERPDLLLTTPESLEAMLVSTRVDPRQLFADLRAVVVDEVHAFAGDDRGWHLLAVLERLQRLAGRPLQRIGLSATVGNPVDLLRWLQGSNAGRRPARVVAPEVAQAAPARPDVALDYVGSIDGAATVISKLHRGEKRLVFCESRRQVEDLTVALRARGVTTYVSHSSLSADERRRAEQAFTQAPDCVIVSTSTLELGIDVGDLDRVIQLDAPRTVSSYLQRLGRSGRRAGTVRNMLFLATTDDALLRAAGLLLLAERGWVEPVVPPPEPLHLVAQQLLALCLQESRVGDALWPEWLPALPGADDGRRRLIVEWLLQSGHLNSDGDMLFVGPEAERRFGRRHFLELVSVFAANPEFNVLHGRRDIGAVDPIVLTRKVEGPRVIVLAGRAWRVDHVDWRRRRCFVEPTDGWARMRWQSSGQPLSYALCQARREVVLGALTDARLSRRAADQITELRTARADQVHPDGSVVVRSAGETWWWTWAGARANAALAAALPAEVCPTRRATNDALQLGSNVTPEQFSQAVAGLGRAMPPAPPVDDQAVRGLKFAELLPPELAAATLSARGRDDEAVRAALGAGRRWRST